MEQNIETKDVQRTEYLDKNGLDILWEKVKENTRNQVEVEYNRAKASENALSSDIQAEATKRENDDNTIKDNLNAEVTRATAKENEIKAEIDVINGDSTTEGSFRKAIADVVGAAPEAYDTLKEIADKLNDNDDLHTAINDAIATKATTVALNEEIARAKAAEEAIIFDVSAHNDSATFESLSALLSSSDLSTLIPTSVRHGGMSIRFIQSSDNKYVQYRLMSTDWSITENDWQGVDDEPTAGSDNLVKSCGVYNSTPTIANSSTESDLDISDEYDNVLVRFARGHIKVKNFDSADINESISAILSNIGFDNITQFSEEEDYDIGEIVRYGKLVYVFTSAHKAGEWDVSQVKETVITTEHPIEVSDEVSEADLDISDEHGNVIMRIKDGHIQTQKFNSLTLAGGKKITYSIIKNL